MEESLSKNEQERLARLKAARSRVMKKIIIWLIILAVIAAGIVWFIDYSRKAAADNPGEEIALLGQEHVPDGTRVQTYNSNPPTSGPHYALPADWGIYDRELPDEQLIHNLEHGGIWISYKDPANTKIASALKDIADDYPTKVILTPRLANDSAIAVAAWGRLLKLEQVDEKMIKQFIKAFVNKGPELVP